MNDSWKGGRNKIWQNKTFNFKYKRCLNIIRTLWNNSWHKLRHLPYFVTVVVQLVIAAVVTVLIQMAWARLHERFSSLPFESVGDWLAFLAILFALIQFTDSKLQETNMHEIAHSVSTRFIGVFPSDLKEITEVIENADHDLLIMVDVLGYGRYSQPKLHDIYNQAICKALKKQVSLRLLHYPATLAQQERLHSFHEANFEEERASTNFQKFREKHPSIPEPKDAPSLRACLLGLDNAAIAAFAADSGRTFLHRELTEAMPFFFWLRDDIEAAFAFNHKGDHIGFAFRTRDTNLVKQFKNIFESRWPERAGLLGGTQAAASHEPTGPARSQ